MWRHTFLHPYLFTYLLTYLLTCNAYNDWFVCGFTEYHAVVIPFQKSELILTPESGLLWTHLQRLAFPLFYDDTQQQLGPRTPSVVYGPNSVRDADWSLGSIRRIDANAIGQRRRDLIIIDCLG